ncbi:MAG: hypothetical protein A2508_03125 [Candidatus Lambdaproteobacteria bacterium RIFOXYD12_FULL_49_8]|uniref:Hemerythrin-like domain-containing protein n=1 Tax=Candidatus Lambdaproteobacteria bacterium RIFOXYD2_FULL_50_16 TaxID=1817772 RepID=A0A1F6GA89_9PROT|nr:MAG: hypothetical protein A2527_12700 [Candidatus Lambdaproteobacteria bacterium RIFOXYD2_FULL_50_16]OGG98291.1 MAG: hypothetical protein A2508_03125 [Candidatus Lambdaproteobacteria bacterium RIFOXYD12_FULL_49_8]
MNQESLIDWNERFLTGIPSIDAQHRALVNIINTLQVALSFGDARPILGGLFSHLQEYIESHFAYEANLLQNNAYPQTAEHLAEHYRFTAGVAALIEQYHQDPSVELAQKTKAHLLDWLVNHVLESDFAYAPFLKSCGVA